MSAETSVMLPGTIIVLFFCASCENASTAFSATLSCTACSPPGDWIAAAIVAVAEATAEGIRKVAESIQQPGGYEAVQLRVAEQYIGEFGKLARTGTTMILPANLSDVGGMIATAMSVIKQTTPDGAANGRPRPAETR